MQDGDTGDSSPKRLIHKPRTRHNVVVTARVLVHRDQKRVRLPDMDIKVGVVLLHGVRSFRLDEKHVVVLDSEV